MSLFNRNAPVTDSNIRILHAVPTANPIDKIGRASCRERV